MSTKHVLKWFYMLYIESMEASSESFKRSFPKHGPGLTDAMSFIHIKTQDEFR